MKRIIASLSLLLPLSGCVALLTQKMTGNAQANANNAVDDAYNQQVTQARATYGASKTAQNATSFSVTVESVYKAGTVSRGKADGKALVTEACGYLDAAATATPAQAPALLAQKGQLYTSAGDTIAAQDAFEASIKKKPNIYAAQPLVGLYAQQGRPDDVVKLCKQTRPNTANDDERYLLLDSCFTASHAATPEAGLTWAGASDVSWYKKQRSAYEAQAAADTKRREEEEQRRADEMRASNTNNNSSNYNGNSNNNTASNAGPTVVSVTVRSSCSQTVRVFFGDKPKYGSGTTSSVSSNSVSSYSKKPGEMIWLVDESDNGISSVTIGASTREVNISCNSISAN